MLKYSERSTCQDAIQVAWKIFEEMKNAHGNDIMRACMDAGVNWSTAAHQLGIFRRINRNAVVKQGE